MAERRIVITEDEYPGNSFTEREQKQQETIIETTSPISSTDYHSETVRRELERSERKPKKLDEDSLSYFVLNDVVRPAIKDFLWRLTGDFFDLVRDALKDVIFGKSYAHDKRHSETSRRDYTRYSRDRKSRKNDEDVPIKVKQPSYREHTIHVDDPSDIIFRTPYEAEQALSTLRDIIRDCGMVKLADFFIMTKSPTSYVDYEWGWKNLNTAYVFEDYNGFYIKFPEVERIERTYK